MPNVKGLGGSFFGFPFCVINIPSVNDDLAYIGNQSTERTFEVEIDIYQEYEARSSVKTYVGSAMKTLRSAESSLGSYGYSLGAVNLPVPPQVDFIEEKQVIRSTILLTMHGEVVV